MPNRFTKQAFTHLHVNSEFSYLDGASHVEALVRCATADGQTALAITDHDNLSAAPEFMRLCRNHGIKPIFGAELTLDTGNVVALAKNRDGYSMLCRMLTYAHLSQERGKPLLSQSMLLENGRGLIVLSGYDHSPLVRMMLTRRYEEARMWCQAFREQFGEDFYIEIVRSLEPLQDQLNRQLIKLAQEIYVPIVATNDVHYVRPEQSHIQDVLTCIRHLIPLDEPHEDRKVNAELYLKSSEAMNGLFADLPEAIQNTVEIANRCESYDIFEPRFLPRFVGTNGTSSAQKLHDLAYSGANTRYHTINPTLKSRIDYELSVITDLGFTDYFLVVHDLVQFARLRKIRHAGRGSAADSVVAYCLDITKVDSFARNLRFERFINPERRNNLPDIDIDFDSRYRDNVTEYVTNKYGKGHVATVCTFARFLARSAIRDIAKTLGFTIEDIDRIAKSTHWATAARNLRVAIDKRPELRALNIPRQKFKLLFDLVEAIDDLPRHISTHLGGVVITGDPIWEISPLQMAAKGVQVIQYDKDGVEDLHLLKLDLLSLRMLGAVEDSVNVISSQDANFNLDQIPVNDDSVFELIQSGNTAGAFQIESPAQMSLHPRLKTSTYEDVVASVALIRPGPVKGEMVEPFVKRRNAQEIAPPVHPVIDKILGHTYGVVLYQEQVISIAIELAGFSPGQADTLRRTISHHRAIERMQEIGETFVAQAVSNGVDRELAEKVFSWLQGYAGYGFCEAHAAAFGDTSYRTAYLLKHHPAEFYAAVLNNQPMGFYPPATITNEARLRGIKVLPPDVNQSQIDFTIENGAIRVALKQVGGISQVDMERIIVGRPYSSAGDFLQRCKLPRDIHEHLVLCGALDSLHANRRALLYSLGSLSLRDTAPALALDDFHIPADVADFTPYEKLCYEWEILGFSPDYHPLVFWRSELTGRGVLTNAKIKSIHDSSRILRAAGWVIRPHTPPTKSGKTVVFLSLEDETGLLNTTVFPAAYEEYGHLIYSAPILMVEGRKDKRGANSLIANRIWKLGKPRGSL